MCPRMLSGRPRMWRPHDVVLVSYIRRCNICGFDACSLFSHTTSAAVSHIPLDLNGSVMHPKEAGSTPLALCNCMQLLTAGTQASVAAAPKTPSAKYMPNVAQIGCHVQRRCLRVMLLQQLQGQLLQWRQVRCWVQLLRHRRLRYMFGSVRDFRPALLQRRHLRIRLPVCTCDTDRYTCTAVTCGEAGSPAALARSARGGVTTAQSA